MRRVRHLSAETRSFLGAKLSPSDLVLRSRDRTAGTQQPGIGENFAVSAITNRRNARFSLDFRAGESVAGVDRSHRCRRLLPESFVAMSPTPIR